MTPVRRSALARHVAAAKHLLRELEEQAETALQSLSSHNGDEFLAAVAERDEIVSQLDVVVEAAVQYRGASDGGATEDDAETTRLFAEMGRAAATVLASHENLVAHARRERDRIAGALHQCARSDAVANQYASTSRSHRSLTISVTG